MDNMNMGNMDNMHMTEQAGINDPINMNIHTTVDEQFNAEQHSSFMRYLEQASVHSADHLSAQDIMMREAAENQMQKTSSFGINLFHRKKSVLGQIPNIQNTTVSVDKKEEKRTIKRWKEKETIAKAKKSISLPFALKKKDLVQDDQIVPEDNLTKAKNLADKASLKDIDVLEWIVMYCLSLIPILNIVVLSMWASGRTPRPEIINWAKANLIIIIATYIFVGVSVYVTLWDTIKLFLPY